MKLKEMGKSVVARTATNPVGSALYSFCGRLSDFFGRVHGHARFTREIGERDETLRKVVGELFPDLVVAAGPFRGMRYPSAQSYGSALLPKLVGSYESELHPALEDMFANHYTTVVDIGCAEGYYAVGLGMRFPNSVVYAFDTNPHARELCSALAKLNGLNARIRIGGICDEAALKSIPLGNKALIVSDCEGYEGSLFSSDLAVELLSKHDLIVEAHDFIDIEISDKLRKAFETTHHIRSIRSTDDIEKAHTYRYAQLDKYDAKMRRLILGERRPAIMEWLVMTPK